MRRFHPAVLAFSVAIPMLQASAALAADRNTTIEPPLGGFALVHLNGAARHVVIGNPVVADVTVDTPHTITVFGKHPGATTLAVLDAGGKVILERRVFVPAAAAGSVTVRYGTGKTWTPGGTTAVVGCSETECAPAAAVPADGSVRGGGAR